MSSRWSVRRRRARVIACATALGVVMAAGVPAALGSYISPFTPASQTVQTQALSASIVLTCSASLGTVTLNWSDPDATTLDPHSLSGGHVISGYVIERSVGAGAFATFFTASSEATLTTTDTTLGVLSLNTPFSYRMHATRSNWVSADSNTVSGRVTVGLIISCPHA